MHQPRETAGDCYNSESRVHAVAIAVTLALYVLNEIVILGDTQADRHRQTDTAVHSLLQPLCEEAR